MAIHPSAVPSGARVVLGSVQTLDVTPRRWFDSRRGTARRAAGNRDAGIGDLAWVDGVVGVEERAGRQRETACRVRAGVRLERNLNAGARAAAREALADRVGPRH